MCMDCGGWRECGVWGIIIVLIKMGIIQTYKSNHMDSEIAHTFLKYESGYDELRGKFMKPKTLAQLQSTTGKEMELEFDTLCSPDIPDQIFNLKNKKMNRYTDIHAYEHSRVKLDNINNYYINANEVKSLVDGNVFAIFSQAPVKNYDNFWEAAYYKHVTVVIMLCSFYDPHRGHQSEQYWPDSGNSATFSAGKLTIKNTSVDNSDKQYIVNKFVMEGPEGNKQLTHIHWMGWSDLKKPVESNMKRFEQILEISMNEIEKKNLIWIHCSAGIGRTGTLGGVIEGIRYYNKNKSISIFEIVENMRKYRYHAVQTMEQYSFLYQYLKKKLS